jgi:hypothetical protein
LKALSSRRVTSALVAAAGALALLAVALLWHTAVEHGDRNRAISHEKAMRVSLATARRDLAATATRVAHDAAAVAASTHRRDDLRRLGSALQLELTRTSGSALQASVAAYQAGSAANTLGRCLQGVQRALNQLSVGDVGGLLTLQQVAVVCKEVRG